MQVIDDSLSIIVILIEFGVFVPAIGVCVFDLANYNHKLAIVGLKCVIYWICW